MFREDFEFHEGAAPSHLGGTRPAVAPVAASVPTVAVVPSTTQPQWSAAAEKELGKIPFFVRGKARRNTERFAQEQGVATITVETLYDAKAHFSR
jgi:light-independent protochlorophyllide reductase subunit B